MQNRYATKAEAIGHVINVIEYGGESAHEFDLDAIADRVFTYDASPEALQRAGFVLTATDDEFWKAVEDNALTEFTARFDEGAEDETGLDGPTGRAVLTLRVYGYEDEQVDALQYVTDDPEAPEDLDDLIVQIGRQGWKVTATPEDDGGEYRLARI